MGSVVIRRMQAGDRESLRPLYDSYVAELVEVGAAYRKDERGTWQPDYFPYWTEPHPTKQVWLFGPDGAVLGFAFVGKKPFPYMSERADQRLVEFFVAPEHRRTKVGEGAATQLFDTLPGRWELSELPKNTRAIAFWRKVLERYTAGRFEETVEKGEPTQRFSSRAKPSVANT